MSNLRVPKLVVNEPQPCGENSSTHVTPNGKLDKGLLRGALGNILHNLTGGNLEGL